MDTSEVEARQTRARGWFETLRDNICEAFEALEREAPAALYPDPAARFVRTAKATSLMTAFVGP